MSESQGKQVMVVGRIVWVPGDLFKGKKQIDDVTKQPKRNKAGEEMIQYGFGLAVLKSGLDKPVMNGGNAEIWAAIHEEAYTLYPSRQLPPGFAWKYKDGDGVDHNGVPFAQREGHAGHLIFACTTYQPIKFFKGEAGQPAMLVNEGIKCGDYVQASITVKAHGPFGQGKAGLYLNPNAVQFLGYGKEIINVPSSDQIFGQTLAPVPMGASAVPLGVAAMPQAPGAPAPMPGYQQPAPAYAPPAPVPQAQPHYAVVPPQFQPPAGGAPAPMPGYQQPAPAYAPQPTGIPMPPGYPQQPQ